MTTPTEIPMIQYDRLPHIFLPLEGQGETEIVMVCSGEDMYWRVSPVVIAAEWKGILAAMREHVVECKREPA